MGINNGWIPISIGVTVWLCASAIIIALRIYRPQSKLHKISGLVVISLIVSTLAAGQVLASYQQDSLDQPTEVRMYRLAEWLHADDSMQSLQLIKRAWEEDPTPDHKWMLGMAYLKDQQIDRAYRLLQESLEEADDAQWIDEEQLRELLQTIEPAIVESMNAEQPVSEEKDVDAADEAPEDVGSVEIDVRDDAENAATPEDGGIEAIEQEDAERVDADTAEQADADQPEEPAIGEEDAERVDADTAEQADADQPEETDIGQDDVENVAADTGTEAGETADLAYTSQEDTVLDHMEDLEPYDPVRSEQIAAELEKSVVEWNTMIEEIVEQVKQSIAKDAELPEPVLEWLAQLDIERIEFSDASGDTSWRQAYDEALAAVTEERIDSPILMRTLASVAIYINNDSMAERLLVKVLLAYPQDEAAAAMLSELYLSGRIQPSDAARLLPQYAIAEQRAERVWLEQQRERQAAEEAAGGTLTESGTSDGTWGDSSDSLADELAYTIVEPLTGEDSSYQLDARMARYYFNSGDEGQASEMIDTMRQKSDQMTIGEQRVLQQVEQQEELTGTDVLDATKRQAQLQAREQVFRNMHSPRQTWDPTISDRSFAYYLQEQLRFPDQQSVTITSIDADEESGQVTLYVRAENVDELAKGQLTLTDNGTEIKDFKLEKIGEAEHHARSIGLVIDVSGSMSGDRIEAAKTATVQFVGNLKDFEQVELIAFSDSPAIVQEMTHDIGELQQAASSLESGGNTNITSALRYELERIAGYSGQRVVMIFTDGEDGTFSMPESRAGIIELANSIGTPVFAIGFGAGYDTLSEVAEATGGQFIAAPNVDTIMNGFADVAKTLERTYTITYQLDPMEAGKHDVELTVRDGLSAEKSYVIGDEASEGALGDSDVELVQPDDRYFIQTVLPGTVQLDKSAGAEITLEGLGLEQTAKVQLGKLRIRDFSSKNGSLTFKLPRDLKEGPYTITIHAKDGRKSEAVLNVLEPGMMQSVKFGWATVYGRWIDANGEEVRISGQASVDHFLYPSGTSDEMVLKGGKELTFEGLHIAVDRTQLPLIGQLVVRGQQLSDRLVHPQVTMRLMDYGEFFRLSYAGADRLTLRRMGLEFAVMDMSYYALKTEGAGRLETKMGLAGWSNIAKTAGNMKLLQSIKFPSVPDAQISARFQPNNLMLRGDVTLQTLGYQSMFEAKKPSLAVEYEFKPNRLLLSGGFDGIEVLGRELSMGPVKGGKITLGWENSTLPKAYGVTVTGDGIPLGATGLTINKFGLLLDFTSASQGSLEAGFGTVVDKVRPFIEKLNDINIIGYKPFDFDPDKVSLIGLDASLGVKKFLASDWEASGQAAVKLLGFKAGERSLRLNRNLMEFGARLDLVLLLDGKVTILYSDPSKRNHLTIGQIGKLTGPWIDIQMRWLVVPANITDSAYSFKGKAGAFDINYHMGELGVYR